MLLLRRLVPRHRHPANYDDPKHHQLKFVNDGKYGNPRSWISSEVGGGWVQIEFPAVQRIDHVVWGRDRNQVYADRLATKYRVEVATVPNQWTLVASGDTRLPYGSKETPSAKGEAVFSVDAMRTLAELSKLKQQKKALEPKAKQQVFAGVFTDPGKTFRLLRGDHKRPSEEVVPDTISILGTLGLKANASDAARRNAFAEWVVHPDNPLTARVAVNRIWHHHFGRGIVGTPGDFGKMGEKPSHPQLLDWLAREFVRGKWSVKDLHRVILLSSTYRQSGRHDLPKAKEVDADNRLLWRFAARRIEAESLRDSVLQVSGSLNLEAGGPGFQLFKPRKGLDSYVPKEQYGSAEWRRMIYAHRVRMEGDGVFNAFDQPDCGQICAKRSRSTTPLQALNLFNSKFMIRQAGKFADRVRREAGDSVEAQVNRAFDLGFGRKPDAAEARASEQLVRGHGLALLCRVIFNANEFVTMP